MQHTISSVFNDLSTLVDVCELRIKAEHGPEISELASVILSTFSDELYKRSLELNDILKQREFWNDENVR